MNTERESFGRTSPQGSQSFDASRGVIQKFDAMVPSEEKISDIVSGFLLWAAGPENTWEE